MMKKDLKGKKRVVPPGIEIPGIPTQKMVNIVVLTSNPKGMNHE